MGVAEWGSHASVRQPGNHRSSALWPELKTMYTASQSWAFRDKLGKDNLRSIRYEGYGRATTKSAIDWLL